MGKNTIEIIKKKRGVSATVNEERKNFNAHKKAIKASLKEGPKSIPDISKEILLPTEQVTYYLMTMMKFGEVETDSIDDMDEYYLYKLTK